MTKMFKLANSARFSIYHEPLLLQSRLIPQSKQNTYFPICVSYILEKPTEMVENGKTYLIILLNMPKTKIKNQKIEHKRQLSSHRQTPIAFKP